MTEKLLLYGGAVQVCIFVFSRACMCVCTHVRVCPEFDLWFFLFGSRLLFTAPQDDFVSAETYWSADFFHRSYLWWACSACFSSHVCLIFQASHPSCGWPHMYWSFTRSSQMYFSFMCLFLHVSRLLCTFATRNCFRILETVWQDCALHTYLHIRLLCRHLFYA